MFVHHSRQRNRLFYKPIISAIRTGGLDFLIAGAMLILRHSLCEIVIGHFTHEAPEAGRPDLWKRSFFLREFIVPYRFRFNAKTMEPGDGLIHIGNAEGQMVQSAGLRIAGPFRTSRNAENLKHAVAQLQSQLIISARTMFVRLSFRRRRERKVN